MTNIKPLCQTHKEVKAVKKEFSEAVDALVEKPYEDLPTADQRNWEVTAMLDLYVANTGEVPDSAVLNKLSNYILADTLRDPTPYKTSDMEYPIESGYSHSRAKTREVAMEGHILDYLHSKYHLRLDSLHRVTRTELRD